MGYFTRDAFKIGCASLNKLMPWGYQIDDIDGIFDLFDITNDKKVSLNEFFEIFRIIQKSTFASPQLQSNTSNSAITSSANENILLIGDIKIQCDSERETSIQMPKLVFPKSGSVKYAGIL